MKGEYFIAVYTNEVKDYCDEQFFHNLFLLSKGEAVVIIDNTFGSNYFIKLKNFFQAHAYNNFHIHHLDVPEHPKESQFQRNVCESVNYLRNIFLQQAIFSYFIILESDVYPPVDLLDKFTESIGRLNNLHPDWGMVGALYYPGFHNYQFNCIPDSLERTIHCLSGCTVYKKALIEKFPFRYNPLDLAPFPDAFISYDSVNEFSLWNEHQIKCGHLHNPLNGMRVK